MNAMTGILQHLVARVEAIPSFDLLALCIFIISMGVYRFFISRALCDRNSTCYIARIQSVRQAWIETYGMGANPILVVQTFRNKIMISSFMASTSIILVIGGFNFIFGLDLGKIEAEKIFLLANRNPDLEMLRVMLIIVMLLYSFFHFLWHTRELHNMSLIINVPAERLQEVTPLMPAEFLAKMYVNSGIHFTLGIRGYYFMIPLLLWMFHPVLMLFSLLSIMVFLVKRDCGMAAYQR